MAKIQSVPMSLSVSENGRDYWLYLIVKILCQSCVNGDRDRCKLYKVMEKVLFLVKDKINFGRMAKKKELE